MKVNKSVKLSNGSKAFKVCEKTFLDAIPACTKLAGESSNSKKMRRTVLRCAGKAMGHYAQCLVKVMG